MSAEVLVPKGITKSDPPPRWQVSCVIADFEPEWGFVSKMIQNG